MHPEFDPRLTAMHARDLRSIASPAPAPAPASTMGRLRRLLAARAR